MRDARGIEPDEIVEKLAADFEITGTAGREALERNYHRLETGRLSAPRSRRGCSSHSRKLRHRRPRPRRRRATNGQGSETDRGTGHGPRK